MTEVLPVAATVVVVRDGTDGAEVLLMQRPDRGSFAGAWVFPGGKLEPGDGDPAIEPEEAVARRAGARETWEECGLTLDPDALVTYSEWLPPTTIPVRIRTWFFVAQDPGGELALSPGEVVAATWARPEDVLERHGRGELTLVPPTWVTLHALQGQPDAASVIDRARSGEVQRFETVMRASSAGTTMLWREDGEYLEPSGGGLARHRLETGELPWVYTRR